MGGVPDLHANDSASAQIDNDPQNTYRSMIFDTFGTKFVSDHSSNVEVLCIKITTRMGGG